MGVIGWSLAFVALVVGARAASFVFEGIVPALLLAAVAAVTLWPIKAANDERSRTREATVHAALGSPHPGSTWLSEQELTDRTSFNRATQEGSSTMTAHPNGKWGRAVGFEPLSRLPQHQHWCYMCGTAHRHDEQCREGAEARHG